MDYSEAEKRECNAHEADGRALRRDDGLEAIVPRPVLRQERVPMEVPRLG